MKHAPEKLCNDTIFKYVLPRKLLAAAKQQVLLELGDNPVIMQESSLSEEQVELYVIAVSLSSGQKEALEALQNNKVMVKKIASADFSVNALQFGD